MIVREFSTELNCLAKYSPEVASSKRGKLKVFLGGLRSNIAKDVMMRDNPSRSLLEAFGRTVRLEAMRHRMT